MNKLKKLAVTFLVFAVAALLIAAGGVLAMHALGLPPSTHIPQPITFALLMGSLFLIFAVITGAIADKRNKFGNAKF